MKRVVEKNISIELTPPSGDYVGKIFLLYNDSLGWAFEFWEAHDGGLGVTRYMCLKEMIVLSPFTFMQQKEHLPKEAYFDSTEQEMIDMVTKMTQEDFKALEKKYRDRISAMENKGLKSGTMLPYQMAKLMFDTQSL